MNIRSKKGIVVIGITLIFALFIYLLITHDPWKPRNPTLAGKVIVLDAGHGGPFLGAVKSGVKEKDLTLIITRYLRNDLKKAGAHVIMTRETDTDLAGSNQQEISRRKKLDLQKRAKIVNQSNADLFVSVHLNSFPSSKWRGAQTFYSPKSVLNERLARCIQASFRTQLGNTDRVALATKRIYLLNQSNVPSALAEVGFLSNSTERNLLTKKPYQKNIAHSIYLGIARYYTDEKTT